MVEGMMRNDSGVYGILKKQYIFFWDTFRCEILLYKHPYLLAEELLERELLGPLAEKNKQEIASQYIFLILYLLPAIISSYLLHMENHVQMCVERHISQASDSERMIMMSDILNQISYICTARKIYQTGSSHFGISSLVTQFCDLTHLLLLVIFFSFIISVVLPCPSERKKEGKSYKSVPHGTLSFKKGQFIPLICNGPFTSKGVPIDSAFGLWPEELQVFNNR